MLTTTIGAYPKPDTVPVLDWFSAEAAADPTAPTRTYAATMAGGGSELEVILDRATHEVVREQDELGIDIPADGEIRRENYIHYHCRRLAGFDFQRLSEKTMRGHTQVRVPTIVGPIAAQGAFLVRDWQVAQAATRKPVKITLPGPLTIGDSVADDFYGDDPRRRGEALADALNVEIRRLADAGCRYIQVDEPVFARQPDNALAFGVAHLERCFQGVGPEVTRALHACCGYPELLDQDDYPKAPQESYGRLAEALDRSSVGMISIEDAHRRNDPALLEKFSRSTVVLGVIAIAKSRVETLEEVRDHLASALAHIDRDRLVAAPDCGLGFLGRDLTRQKLAVLTAAAASI